MKIAKEDFEGFISSYTEDEIFYRSLYVKHREGPDAFNQYLHSLDEHDIARRRLYVPELATEAWLPYMEEQDLFSNIPGNILFSKHYRYTPVFTHEHEFFEILCVYDGTADTTIQGISHTLNAGDICIIPPNTKHSIGIFDDSTAFNIIIRASTFQSTFFQTLTATSALSQFFSHVLYKKTKGNYLIFHTGESSQVRSLLEDMYIEYLGHQKYSPAFLNSMLMLFWAQLLRYHENDVESILTKEYSGSSVTEILNYLHQHYRTASLSDTSEYFGYSPSHFSTLIKESTGQTFLQIVKNIKLGQACHALKDTTLNISAICELVGYENPEHFMRTFKKIYGMTPSQYRTANTEK